AGRHRLGRGLSGERRIEIRDGFGVGDRRRIYRALTDSKTYCAGDPLPTFFRSPVRICSVSTRASKGAIDTTCTRGSGGIAMLSVVIIRCTDAAQMRSSAPGAITA